MRGDPIETLRSACEAQFPEDHDWPDALARLEALRDAALHLNRKIVKHNNPIYGTGSHRRFRSALAGCGTTQEPT